MDQRSRRVRGSWRRTDTGPDGEGTEAAGEGLTQVLTEKGQRQLEKD